MRCTDIRSGKIAVISDKTFNAHILGNDASAELLSKLASEGYGLIVLPPADVELEVAKRSICYAVDQLQDYAKNGYQVFDAQIPQDNNKIRSAFLNECKSRGLCLPTIDEN